MVQEHGGSAVAGKLFRPERKVFFGRLFFLDLRPGPWGRRQVPCLNRLGILPNGKMTRVFFENFPEGHGAAAAAGGECAGETLKALSCVRV